MRRAFAREEILIAFGMVIETTPVLRRRPDPHEEADH